MFLGWNKCGSKGFVLLLHSSSAASLFLSYLSVQVTSFKIVQFRKYPYSPHRRDCNFLGVGRSVTPKKCLKLYWNFQ